MPVAASGVTCVTLVYAEFASVSKLSKGTFLAFVNLLGKPMDTIANMLTSIVNGQAAGKQRVAVPYSKFKERLAELLVATGKLASARVQEGPRPKLILTLAYNDAGQAAIGGMKRLSTPGRRRYAGSHNIPFSLDGFGSVIVSTPQGLMEGKTARQKGLGGELICEIW